ncbi:hypothetical protein D3C78_532680 [compost metagenome]
MALIVVGEAVEDGLVGHFLHVAGHRGGDAEAFGVGVATVAADHFGAGHFGDVRCIHFRRGHVVAGVERLGQGCLVAGFVDLAQLVHAAEDPVAALLGAHRVGQRVEARGCLGQAGDHRHLRQAHVADRLAVVHLRGGIDAVGAVAQVDLVHVQLEDLVLGQLALDLQGQQNLVGLAREAALAGEEEVLRHLHGDGTAAGLDMAGFHQLGRGAHQAAGVDTIVVEEIVVLGRQKRLDELWGNFREADRRATHFAELGNQLAVAAVHPEGDLQLDASERLDRGQAGAKIQKRTAHTEYERADDCDGRPPEELQQTYQGFSVSRLGVDCTQVRRTKKRWAL